VKNRVLEAFSAVILLVGAFIVINFSGCEEAEPIKLKGTTWKLKGIYNANTKEFKVLASEECNDCYSFTFDTCDKTPSFDFTKGSVLFTSGHTASSIFKISVKLTKQDNTNYKCLVDVQEDYTAKPDSWKRCYWVSQKIDPKAKITISINKHH